MIEKQLAGREDDVVGLDNGWGVGEVIIPFYEADGAKHSKHEAQPHTWYPNCQVSTKSLELNTCLVSLLTNIDLHLIAPNGSVFSVGMYLVFLIPSLTSYFKNKLF